MSVQYRSGCIIVKLRDVIHNIIHLITGYVVGLFTSFVNSRHVTRVQSGKSPFIAIDAKLAHFFINYLSHSLYPTVSSVFSVIFVVANDYIVR